MALGVADLYLTSSSGRKPLRVGLMLDGTRLPRWVRQVVEDLQRSNFASLELVVVRREPSPGVEGAPPPLPARAWRILRDPRRRRSLLFRWYGRLDARRWGVTPDPLEDVDCADLLDGVARIVVTPIATGATDRFAPDAIERIRARDLDVILGFGGNLLRGEVLRSARFGIWSFHHGDNDYYRGGPAYFWELVEGSPLVGAALQVLTEELDAGLVLGKVLFSSVPGLSLQQNQWGPYWGSTHLVIRLLQALHQHGWDYVLQRSVAQAPYRGRRPIYRPPTNGEVVRWLAPAIVRRALTRPFRTPSVDHWRIAVRVDGPTVHGAAGQGRAEADLRGFRFLESPRGRFWADPFLCEHAGLTWLFFEDFRYREERGVISVAALRDDGTVGEARTCLDLPYHLSFPNVFRHDGEVFMIPETRRHGTVELYRATRFPFEWTLERILFRGNGTDTSPWFDGQRWWFFVGMQEPAGHVALSLLFFADTLTGDWTAHPANPISADVRSARNAGAIFSSGGRLFRPSQDCAGGYGRSLSLNEIVTLTPEAYAERRVLTLVPDPSWACTGAHTYNFGGRFEVIDAVRPEPRAAHR